MKRFFLHFVLVVALFALEIAGCSAASGNGPIYKRTAYESDRSLIPSPDRRLINPDRDGAGWLDLHTQRPPGNAPGPGNKPARARTRSIIVVGDSLAVGLGITLGEFLEGHPDITVRPEGRISSGLNSPKFFDWEKKITELVEENDPDAIVVLIGGNDAYLGSTSTEWAQAFRERVQSFLRLVASRDIKVFWVELPPMADEQYTRRVKVANEVMASVCSKTADCHFIRTWDLCADEEGKFTIVKSWEGQNVILRVPDGAHFTRVGYETLSRYIFDAMRKVADDLPEISDEPAEALRNDDS